MRSFIAAIVVLFASLAHADFPFDPDGGGPKPVFTVGSFDFLVGNSLSKGVFAGDKWTLYYQASLGSLSDSNGNAIPNSGPNGTGLNVDHEITVVAAISVKTTMPGQIMNFALDPAGANFVRIYHDTAVNANPLEGTGYSDGELILESHATDDLQGALFVSARTANLDSFGSANQWPSVKSYTGLGAFQCSSVVSSFSRDYFKLGDGLIDRISINSSEQAPYRQMKPSKLFWDGTSTFAPAIGAVNLKTGPDALLQADANASFQLRD